MQMLEVAHHEGDDDSYYIARVSCPVCGRMIYLGSYGYEEEGPTALPAEKVIALCLQDAWIYTQEQREKHEKA